MELRPRSLSQSHNTPIAPKPFSSPNNTLVGLQKGAEARCWEYSRSLVVVCWGLLWLGRDSRCLQQLVAHTGTPSSSLYSFIRMYQLVRLDNILLTGDRVPQQSLNTMRSAHP